MKFLIAFLIVLFLILQYGLWFQHDNVFESLRLHSAVAREKKINDKLYQRNQKLAAKIFYLKHTKLAVEDLARKQIGMVKPGEEYYQFVKGE